MFSVFYGPQKIFKWIKLVAFYNISNTYLLFKGAYFAWKATAMGKNHINGKTFLEKR